MKYVVNWIPLRIRVRATNTQPHLKGDINEAPTCAVLVHAPVTNGFGEERSGVQPRFFYILCRRVWGLAVCEFEWSVLNECEGLLFL